MKINIPTDKKIIQGTIADYYFMDNGILVSLSKSPKRTIENIRANKELIAQITGNKKVPLLIYLTSSPMPNKATRKYVNQVLPEMYTAMAMISDNGLGKFIMNVLFKFNKPVIPMKSFSNEADAVAWLKDYL